MAHGRLVHVGETVTNLKMLGSELHQNVSGSRAPPGPDGVAMVLPKPLAVITVRKGGNRKEMVGIGNEGKVDRN